MRIRDGFPGQRLRVLPADITRHAARSGMTARLLVTDAGYFPRALHHGRARRHGTASTIVIVCSSGRGYCRTDDRLLRVDAHQALVIAAGAVHEYWADDADPWTIWWFHVLGPDALAFEEELRQRGLGTGAVVDIHDLLRIVTLMEQVVEAMEADETRPSVVRAAGAAWRVLAELAADTVSGHPARGEPVRAAQEYLRAHYGDPLQVAELAGRFGYSTSHFSAMFRKATGSGVVEYLKRLRVARASELLVTTSEPIGDIGSAVGYADPLYFSRQFRSVHGCSPSEFRRRGSLIAGESGRGT